MRLWNGRGCGLQAGRLSQPAAEILNGAVEIDQERVRPNKPDCFLGFFGDGLDILRLDASVTLMNGLNSDSASNLR